MKLIELLQFIEQVSINIGASKPMIVGGTPRDKFLGKLTDISDIDITTGDETVHHLAKEVNIRLNKSMKTQYKKGRDGHSSILLGNLKLDFSSNFNALYIDQFLKEKGIENPTPLQRELYSRDFTINTLLMEFDLKTLHDFTGQAIPDLKNKIIRTCLHPEVTFKDSKRVFRSIYLAAKLNFNVSPEIISFVRDHGSNIDFSEVSKNGVIEKLAKAMSYDSAKTLRLLKEMNLDQYIPAAKRLKGL